MPNSLISHISPGHVAISSAAADHLYSKDSRPRLARDLARISNALSEMLLSEGLGHTLSDRGSVLNNAIEEAQALCKRLRWAINFDRRELNNNDRELSFALMNRAVVLGKSGNFLLQKNNVLKRRPPRISHCIKMAASSTYRNRVDNTKKHFANTKAVTIRKKLDENIKRLNCESRKIITNIWAITEQHSKVIGLLKDLRKIEQQKSKVGLPSTSSDTLNYRTSI